MNRHASMNRIFRLVWNESLNAYVPAAETARGRGKSSKRKLVAVALSLSAGIAQAGPTGGQVTGGSGTIGQSGTTTTIQQSSQNLALNWQTFNIAPRETVDFIQPNATAIAVNRILDPNGSVILGHLNANGQVYLINPNGVLFGKGAEVNVGGLVASTLNFNDGTLGDASKTFSGTGSGSVVNDGTLNAASGGSIALFGNHVSNNGVISAQLGTVALGAGSAATLTFRGTHLVTMQVDQSVLNSVAANGGLIRADGGQVLMTAGAQKSLLASVVNNTGVIEARTLENHEGTITLLGGMTAGTVNESGTLDASAARGGNGGSIETSAARVKITDTAKISTAAAMGLNGTWRIDPDGFTIASSGGDMTGTALTAALANGDVNIQSTSGGGSDGNVNVNDAVSWSANKLALTATNDVNVNAVMTASGAASLDLAPGSNNVNMGFNPDGSFKGRVDFSGSGILRMNVAGTLQTFTVISSLGQDTDAIGGANTLQGIAAPANISGNFALGSNIDATATSGWNSGAGFTPIGSFTGNFDGLGHTVSNLTINRPTTVTVAMFRGNGTYGQPAPLPFIRNVGLVGVTVVGQQIVGGLVGTNYGLISNSFASGDLSVSGAVAGGLVGANYGTGIINNSHAIVNVSMTGRSTSSAGGLVGSNYGALDHTYASGDVSADNGDANSIGGLVGYGRGGSIANSYATGNVTASYQPSINGSASHNIGGLIGNNGGGTIDESYATGVVTVLTAVNNVGTNIGGLAGNNSGAIAQSYSTGSINAGSYSTRGGGLVGVNNATITTSYATGNVNGSAYAGGLVGANYGTVSASHATGAVSGTTSVGGLVGGSTGQAATSITDSYATGSVSGSSYVGGLIGFNNNIGAIATSFATGSVTGGRYTGGLVGNNLGSVTNVYSIGNVSGTLNVGGLVGMNTGTVSDSYASGLVTGGNFVGALIGANYGTLTNSFYASTVNSSLTGIGGNGAGTADVAGTVMGMSAANMQAQANFTSATTANGGVNPGWDLNNNAAGTSAWFMYEGETAPLLRVFLTPLTVTGTVTQTYNGAVFAPTIGNFTYSIVPDASHLAGTVTVTGSAVGASHAGTYSFTPGGLYSDQLGYMISYSAGSVTINPAPLTVVGSTANKVYDGTTVAPLNGMLVGVIGGDTVTLTQAGTFASKNVGTGIAITANDSIGGASAGDYTLVEPTGVTGTITPATLTVSGTTVGGKTYNGTTAASLTGGSLVGVIGGDTVTLTQAGSFASKNAGTGIAVTAADGLGGSDASDYTIVEPTGLAGTITPATLTVSGTMVGGKTYNGTTDASLTGGSLVGVVSGDTVTLNQSGTFASADVGSGIAVTATDSLSGTSAFDYSITEPTGLTGSILPASNPPSSSSGLVLAALNARTQIVENFIYPQLGTNPQVINPSPTIAVLATSAESASEGATGSHQAIAVNVSMKIGANGTLKIENGGLRLPSNLVVGNE